MEIQPKETRYSGYVFRSRLEARWAIFFDALGLEWQYEPENFELDKGVFYLPDFYLPKWDCYVEVKPSPAHVDKRPEMLALAGKRVVIAVHAPSDSIPLVVMVGCDGVVGSVHGYLLPDSFPTEHDIDSVPDWEMEIFRAAIESSKRRWN